MLCHVLPLVPHSMNSRPIPEENQESNNPKQGKLIILEVKAAVSTTWSNAMEAQPWVLNKNLQVIFTLCMVKVQSKQGMEATAECNSRTDF